MTIPTSNGQSAGRVTWISPSRAAKLIGCSERHIYHLLEAGELLGYQPRPPRPGKRSGSWWKVDFQSVVDYIGRERSAAFTEISDRA